MKEWQKELAQDKKSAVGVFPGISELVRELSSKGIALFVWTLLDRQTMLRRLEEVDLWRYFEASRNYGECRSKPDPEGLEQLLSSHCSPEHSVVIGDSYTDIMGAKAYGSYAIGAAWDPLAKPNQLHEFGAHAVFDSPMELLGAFC